MYEKTTYVSVYITLHGDQFELTRIKKYNIVSVCDVGFCDSIYQTVVSCCGNWNTVDIFADQGGSTFTAQPKASLKRFYYLQICFL